MEVIYYLVRRLQSCPFCALIQNARPKKCAEIRARRMTTATPLKSSLWSMRLTVLVAASAVLVVLMSALGTRSITALSDRADWVAHTERVRFEVVRILRLVTDVET